MQEMTERGYRVSPEWLDKKYRGKQMPAYDKIEAEKLPVIIYPEHDTAYLQQCLDNLKQKESSSKGGKRCIYLSG